MRTLRPFLLAGALTAPFGVLSIGCGGSTDSAETATATGTTTAGHGGAGGAGGHATTSTATGAGGAGGTTTAAGGAGGATTSAGGSGGTGTTGTGGSGGTGTTGAGGSGGTTTTGGTGGNGSGGGTGTTTTSGIVKCVWGNDECGPGQLCHAPGCGTGMCVPKNAAPPNTKNAVCGCDGVTYWNGGVASAHAMSPKHDGECKPAEDVSCGGFGGQACAKGQFCNYVGTKFACGASDAMGSCWGMPSACPDPDQPGSGADVRACLGGACDSECAAIQSEATYYLADDCGGGGGGGGGGGSTTTSSTSSTSSTTTSTSTSIACAWGSDVCGDGQYCNAPGCGKGVCAPIFGKISAARAPVCGCDGVTYWNGTLAKSGGMSVRNGDDACAADEAASCSSMKPCGKGQSCNIEGLSVCQSLEPKGTCWKLPSSCPGGVNDGANMRDCKTDTCKSECELIAAQAPHHTDLSCPQLF